MNKAQFVTSKTWHFLKAMWFVWVLRPILIPFLGSKNYWVISGHRGRAYQDNSAQLHHYVATHTEQEIIWITKNQTDYQHLKSQGHLVLRKNSFSARVALLQADKLIYSHGEDDLDSHLLYWVKSKGLKIYLNHCLNLLKTGQMAQKSVESMSLHALEKFKKNITRFDYILASSDQEKAFFKRSFLAQDHQYILGGGAHLDQFFKMRSQEPSRTILYFPTFRDSTSANQNLQEMIQRISHHDNLQTWLQANDYEFIICHHINSTVQLADNPKSRVTLRPAASIISLMSQCELFISDYSGLIADYLILDKPFVAFPFDLEEYLEIRNFYTSYEDHVYGPIHYKLEGLIQSILDGSVFEENEYKAIRNTKMDLYFPHHDAVYSERCYQTIQGLTSTKR